MYNLRGGFLVRPLIIALALGCAGALLSWLEETFPGVSAWVPRAIFPSHADPQVAQVILAGIAASIMTVVSIVFAILLMTLTLASMQFSPRIIMSFSRDRRDAVDAGHLPRHVFLLHGGAAGGAVAAAPVCAGGDGAGRDVLALTCVGWLLFFIHHISQAISVNHIVDRIATETESVIDEVMPWPHWPERLQQTHLPPRAPDEVRGGERRTSGYIRFIDTRRLARFGEAVPSADSRAAAGGSFCSGGDSTGDGRQGGAAPTTTARARLLSAFDMGPTRTLQQDVEFGVLQIVDIALKAISPAVNDPSTGINCVDQLSRIMIRFASRQPPDELMFDPPGVIRVSLGWIQFPRLLDAAFEQIRMYAKGDVAVSLRLLRALGDIAASTPDAEFRQILVERGWRTVAGCAEKLGPDEMRELRMRQEGLAALAEVVSS